jgi:predicted amidohydrolase YtcJ
VVVQRVHAMTSPTGAGGLRPLAITLGPVKVVLDDDALPPFDELSALVAAAHRRGQRVAVHCVTRVQLVLALSALDAAGALPGDRIEHGALIGADVVPWLDRLGLTVVTQPSFIAERGDRYLLDVEAGDVAELYRCRSLLESGVGVAAGSDAPFGALDPWAAMRAAVTRRTRAGATVGAHERVTPEQALGLFLGHRDAPAQARRIAVGESADLCLLAVAYAEALGEPSGEHVRAVVIGGRLVHGSEDI